MLLLTCVRLGLADDERSRLIVEFHKQLLGVFATDLVVKPADRQTDRQHRTRRLLHVYLLEVQSKPDRYQLLIVQQQEGIFA